MLKRLDSLQSLVEENKPTNLEAIYFLFFEQGIGFNEFKKLPLPYIMSMLKVNSYKIEQEIRAQKKNAPKR